MYPANTGTKIVEKDMNWIYRMDGVDACSKMGPQGSCAVIVK
jgi:hypothetical protein